MKRSREHDEGDEGQAIYSPESTSNYSRPAAKITGLDESAIEDDEDDGDDDNDNTYNGSSSSRLPIMRCSLPPHREVLSFKTYADYDSHYHKAHFHRCVECAKNFPSEHLLSVHIEDCHDAFASVKRDKGEHTYSCFVEDCDRKCRTHQKRRQHLIDKHMYPKNYFFGVTKDGIDGRQSLLLEAGHHRRRSSALSDASNRRRSIGQQQQQARRNSTIPDQGNLNRNAAEQGKEQPSDDIEQQSKKDRDVDMEDLTGAMSSLQFVPPSVKFGRGGKRTGFSRR